MTNIKVVVFDFDGTIVDSNLIKQEAFIRIGKQFGIEPNLMRAYLQSIKGDRYSFFSQLEERKIGGKAVKMIAAFTKYCESKITEAPEIPGAINFISEVKKIGIPQYILSATPQKELVAILSRRDLLAYFKDVIGVRENKAESLKDILKTENASPNEVLFFGDQWGDYIAAVEIGTKFFAVQSRGSYRDWDSNVYSFRDYTDLRFRTSENELLTIC